MSDSDTTDSVQNPEANESFDHNETFSEVGKLGLLKKVLTRFTKDELSKYVLEFHLDFCRLIPKETMRKNKSIILQKMYQIVMNVRNNDSLDQLIARLNMLYVALHHDKKSWTAYEINSSGEFFTDHVRLRNKLTSQLKRKNWHFSLDSLLWDESFWFHLLVHTKKTGSTFTDKDVFMHYHSLTSLLLISGRLNKDENQKLLEALADTFQSPGLEVLNVRASYGVGKLTRMVLQKHGNRLTDAENLPILIQQVQLKRKQPVEEYHSDIQDLDLPVRKKRRHYLESVYGAFEVPKLQKVTIHAHTKFYGFAGGPRSEEKVKSKIEFKGSDVLEGFYEMVEEGTIHPKLPKHLEDIVISGTDNIYITD